MNWTQEQVDLFETVMSHVSYSDSSAATTIRESLISSLTANPVWNQAQVELFSDLLDLALYSDATGGGYANALIAQLGG